MNIRQLEIFKKVCEVGSMSEAAKQLYISQPAISKVIVELEDELGYLLFDRFHKKIYLNPQGKKFLDKVDSVLKSFERLKEKDECPHLDIGSCITIANFWLPDLLVNLKKALVVDVNVRVDSAANILERLANHQLDLALIEGNKFVDDVKMIPFSEYEIVALSKTQHPPMKLKDLEKECLLIREQGSAIRDVFDSLLLLHQIHLTNRIESVNSQALIQMAKAGLGIAILPRILAEDELKEEMLYEIELEEFPLVNQNYLVYYKNCYKNEAFQLFVELILSLKQNLLVSDGK